MYIWLHAHIYIILHIWTCLCWDSSGSCLATSCISFNPFNCRPLASRGHQSLPASVPRRPVACQLAQWHCELQKSTKHVPQSSRPSSGSSTDWKLNCWGCGIFFRCCRRRRRRPRCSLASLTRFFLRFLGDKWPVFLILDLRCVGAKWLSWTNSSYYLFKMHLGYHFGPMAYEDSTDLNTPQIRSRF